MLLIQFIILQIIVFGAVIYFLKKIMYSDTQSAVNRLDKTYQDLLAKQKELSNKIETAEKDYETKRQDAAQVSEKMKQEALDKIREKEEEILKSAKAEADETVKKARSSSEKIRREIEKDVRLQTVDYVSNLLNAGLSPGMMQVMHAELIAEFVGKEKQLDFSTVSPSVDKLVIRTPMELKAADKEKVVKMVERKLGRTMTAEVEEEKSLIAGIALQFGTLVLDGSFANAINESAQNEKRKIELEA